MKRTHLRHMLAVVGRILTVLVLTALPVASAQGQEQRAGVGTSGPTTWLQLINSQQGYALQYPSGSRAILYQPEGVLHVKLNNEVDSFIIKVYGNPNRLPAQNWIALKLAENQRKSEIALEPVIRAQDFEEIQVGDQRGSAFLVSAFDHMLQNVVLASRFRAYEISFPAAPNPNDPQSQEHDRIFREILTTFRIGSFDADQGFEVLTPQRTTAISDLNVPLLNQLDSSWKCNQLGTCACGCTYGQSACCKPTYSWLTIGGAGCAITSLAMVSNSYRSDFTNPDQINSCLKQNSQYAYDSGGCGNCLVYWSNSCMPSGVSYNGSDSSKIDDDLRNGRPVVANIGGHYVVIIGKRDDGRYNINDPWGGVRRDISASQISGVRRYQGSSTPPPSPTPRPNRPPNTPSPQSPDDWHVARDGRAPTLCWNKPGDPDDDAVQFYAEVYGSAVNANSGWTSNNCWRPGELDGRYFGYQWHVKAKDSRGAESGWSSTWHFTIEAPNAPPTISFDTANNNGDGRITSRDQGWTFRGTAGDPEGRFSRVEFRCTDCDNRGSGEDRSTSTSWAIARNGMSGRNYVFFEAFDDKQSTRSAKTLELNIDLAPPATEIQINGRAADAWPQWFTEPAQVRLTARDNGTGRAVAEVAEVRYGRDGGGQQTQSGGVVNFTEGGDGEHTVRYSAVDRVGNAEGERSAAYRVDRTPPTAIAGVSESNGAPNDAWQRAQNKPTFTWDASTDPSAGSGSSSGLGGYQFYFGPDAGGTAVHFDVSASAERTLTPNNLGVATGTYYLRGRTWDRAGNAAAWATLFTFRYDGAPPENPTAATHALGANVVRNDVWQRTTSQADFTWPVPHDEGSGVQDYAVYWGADPAGASNTRIATPQYRSPAPLCGANDACTGYLRLRSRDNVDNEPAGWSTAFVLRYDNAPPAADFTFTQGVTTTQTLVNLKIAATDQGSGLREMRLSSDGAAWTPWEVYAAERPWEIPGISRQSWPVYLQVRDGVGLTSAVISHTIYLDVNPQQPRSAGFRLFDYAMSAGGGDHASAGYSGRSTVGQVVDSAVVTSTGYILRGGYQAGSQARPIVEPGHDEFEYVNGIFASGTGATTLASPTFRMVGTLGEIGVPNNATTLLSQRHQLQPGFLAAAPRANTTPTPTPTPGPTPTPSPTPACEFPRVSINDGAIFTTETRVTLSPCAPNATEMMVSNDGGFGGAVWEPYARSKSWTLTSHSDYVVPRFVYAAFRDARGQIYATFLDDIILDPLPPEAKVRVGSNLPLDENLLAAASAGRSGAAIFQAQGRAYLRAVNDQSLAAPIPLVGANADGAVALYLSARDNVGNVRRMQVSADGSFGGDWEDYNALKQYTPTGGDGVKTVYARFQDEAGNVSQPVSDTFMLDTLPPLGGIALSHPILGPDVVTTTVWLGAEDNLSGVAAMRLSTDPTFADAVWRPFTPTLTWVYSSQDRSRDALHVQFRDAAGNESEVYAAPLLVDAAPPVVYAEVAAGATLTRTIHVYAYDGMVGQAAGLATLRLTNDPLFLAGVVTQPYTDTVTWAFDDRRVVWAQVKDSVGNWSEPYPAYASPATTPPGHLLYLPLIVR
jgi:hypothetical protein